MPFIRSRNAAMLMKLESVEGVFDAPDGATGGILVESPQIAFNPQNTETNEVTGSLDGRGPLVGGMQCQITGKIYLKGPGEPGVAPEWGKLLKICSWAETVTLTDITATTISVTDVDEISDSGSGLAALTVGTPIFVKGFTEAANVNRELVVTASAAGAITVSNVDGTPAALVVEAAGDSVTIRRGIAGAAATGGTTISATAQAPWAATAQLYRGKPVLLSGNPATPKLSFIADYTAARVATFTDLFSPALDNVTDLGIPAHVFYQPISTGIPSASFEYYMDGVVYRFAGARGNIDFTLESGGACSGNFTISAMFESQGDAAVPTPTYDGTRPPTWRNSAFLINRQAAALSTFSLGSNGQLTFPDDPNQQEGFSPPQFTGRRVGGSMDPFATLKATRDLFAILHGRVQGGAAAPGNRIGVTVPLAFYETFAPGDKEGLSTEAVGFFAQGQDSGAQIVVW